MRRPLKTFQRGRSRARLLRRRLCVWLMVLFMCLFVSTFLLSGSWSLDPDSTAPGALTSNSPNLFGDTVHKPGTELSVIPLPTVSREYVWFQRRTTPLQSPELHYTDAFDFLPPRDGESFISFDAYLDCLAARLHVDRVQRRELSLESSQRLRSFPYLLIMATGEIPDVKALMCNLTVPIRHLMYVQNGDLPSMSAFFDDVQRAFNFTDRLKIHRFRDNIGFAGAVNEGIRDAMRYPFDEVPFYAISNNDVRFAPSVLGAAMEAFHAGTARDEARLRALEEEVAREGAGPTPAGVGPFPHLRTGWNDSHLSTSRLLPNRVRSMAMGPRRRTFSDHYGALFYSPAADTSSWAMSRLMLETVGLWDENFYPAYYEDTDYRMRQRLLGFRDLLVPADHGGMVHYGSVTIKHGQSAGTASAKESPQREQVASGNITISTAMLQAQHNAFYKGLLHIIGRGTAADYMVFKWGSTSYEETWEPYIKPFTGPGDAPAISERFLPLDCWVNNVKFRTAVAEATQLAIAYFAANPEVSVRYTHFLSFLPLERYDEFALRMMLSPNMFSSVVDVGQQRPEDEVAEDWVEFGRNGHDVR